MKRLYVILAIFISSCTLVVDVDIPLEKNKMVLNSFITPDSTWEVQLTLNKHILDDAPNWIVGDAVVSVYDGETFIETLEPDWNGYYRSHAGHPVTGKNYVIKANHSEYGEVSSATMIPVPVPMTVENVSIENKENDGGNKISLDMTFTDPPGESNFYQVMMVLQDSIMNPYTGENFLQTIPVMISSDDTGIDNEDIGNEEGFFFNDNLFSGREMTIHVKAEYWHWGNTASKAKYTLYFRTLSKAYYDYKVTSLLQDYASGDPFAQPVKVFNNIENGFGIFAGYNQSVFTFEP